IPTKNKPKDDAVIYYIDADPLKEEMPLWYIPSKRFYRADSLTTLKQLNKALKRRKAIDTEEIENRRKKIQAYHDALKTSIKEKEKMEEDIITPEFLTASVREIMDEDTVVLNEAITNYGVVNAHIEATAPGSYYSSGAGSLGWNGGAALGIKLAQPEKTVISLTGDGCYYFSVPSVVHTMSEQCGAPFLTIIYNNRGWNAPKHSTL